MNVRSHLAATSDRSYDTSVLGIVAKGFEEPPRDMIVKETVLRCGISGARPSWSYETNRAFGKRVGGAPTYQHPLNIDLKVKEVFDKFATVAFRGNWKEVVKNRIGRGMWQPRKETISEVLGKMQPSGVGKVNAENFSMATILMNEYDAIVKRQPKDKLNLSVAQEHGATQTIMFQPSKATNAYFSSIMSEVNDCADDILDSHVLVNLRRDKVVAENVWNSSKQRTEGVIGEKVVDVDIGQCDKSQTEFNLMLYIYLLKQLGMPLELEEFFDMLVGKKKATAWESNLAMWFMWQVVSGLFYTIGVNSWVVAMATIYSLGVEKRDLSSMLVGGDDVLLRVVLRVTLDEASDCFASLFNFEVKVFETLDPYWCGRYIVGIEGYDFFVKDPERLYSALAKYQLKGYDPKEAFVSFVDDTSAYQWQECVEAVGKAAQRRNARRVSLLPIAQGIATIRTSEELFLSRFRSETYLSI